MPPVRNVKWVLFIGIAIQFYNDGFQLQNLVNLFNDGLFSRNEIVSCLWLLQWVSVDRQYLSVASESVIKPCIKNDNPLVD